MNMAETRRNPSEKHLWKSTKLIEGFLPEISTGMSEIPINIFYDLEHWRNNQEVYHRMLLAARDIAKSGWRVEIKETVVTNATPVRRSISKPPLCLDPDVVLMKIVNSIMVREKANKIPPSDERIQTILAKAGKDMNRFQEIWVGEIKPLFPREKSDIADKLSPIIKRHIKQITS
jgi:hypothetical protein